MASVNKIKCLQKHSLCFFVCGMDNCVWAVSSFVTMTRDLIINADTAPHEEIITCLQDLILLIGDV